MDNHLITRREGFAAELAAVWPRVSVNSLVLTQQISPLKVLWAEGALERPVVSVDAPNVE